MNAARHAPARETTMADRNPFAVNVPSAVEALAVGDQSYRAGRELAREGQRQQARQRVAQDILNGGDIRSGVAQLIAGDDVAGAVALGHLGKPDTTNEIREYNLSRSQGFPGTFIDWKNALSRFGARQALDGNATIANPNLPGPFKGQP